MTNWNVEDSRKDSRRIVAVIPELCHKSTSAEGTDATEGVQRYQALQWCQSRKGRTRAESLTDVPALSNAKHVTKFAAEYPDSLVKLDRHPRAGGDLLSVLSKMTVFSPAWE